MSQARGTFILNTEPLKAIDNYSINLKNISILIPINGILILVKLVQEEALVDILRRIMIRPAGKGRPDSYITN
jgi:hypothetical protein